MLIRIREFVEDLFMVLVICLLFVLQTSVLFSQELNLVKPKPAPAATVADAIEAHLKSAAAVKPRKLIAYTQVGCPPCAQTYKNVGTGFPGVEIEWRYEQPAWLESYPAIVVADVNVVEYGLSDRERIGSLLKRNPRPGGEPAPMAFGIGKIQAKSFTDQLFSRIKMDRGSPTIQCGSADILFPAKFSTSVEISESRTAVTFTDTKPTARFMLFRVDVTGFIVAPDKITVIMPAPVGPLEMTVVQ